VVLALVIIPTNPNDIFAIPGICLEILGFLFAFFAIKPKPDGSGGGSKTSFSSKSFSKQSFTTRLIKRMTEIHPRLSKTSVALVIIGLGFQLVSQFMR
jgi:hypothetical protein